MFHPARPEPITAPAIDSKDFFKVLTPEVTAALNGQVERKERPPYAYMCMGTQDYLTIGAWNKDVERYVKQANQIFDYYRNLDNPPSPGLKGNVPSAPAR